MRVETRKSTQRTRLLQGIVKAANRRGYAGASVSEVIAEAGVSRRTFYDYFEDRNDCFRAAIEDVQETLLGRVRTSLAESVEIRPWIAALTEIVSFAAAEPDRARFLMAESMGGGAEALTVRNAGIRSLADAISDVPLSGPIGLDMDPVVAIGAVYRLIATRLRRGEAAIGKLADDLPAWIACYERPSSELRWSKLAPRPVPGRSVHVPTTPIQDMPSVFPPGRPRVPEAEIAENHRLRVLYAAAKLAQEKGYADTTVADITRLASIDGRAFYRHFADKQEAFSAVHELGFQLVMDVTAKAFFAAEGWPRRSWEAGLALTGLLQENPLVAYLGFVEAYAVGQAAVQRIEESHVAFMFFLQEGLLGVGTGPVPSRLGMEAVVAAIFEIIYLRAQSKDPQMTAMLPAIAHVWLTPFLGSERADAFIDARVGDARDA